MNEKKKIMKVDQKHWHGKLTCNCVRTFVFDPVIWELSFKKCEIKRRSSLRFIPSISDVGTNRSSPNSLLEKNKIFDEF